MGVVDDSYGYPLKDEEKAAMPLAGGIANMGFQCGMLWGAALAAGRAMMDTDKDAETIARVAEGRT